MKLKIPRYSEIEISPDGAVDTGNRWDFAKGVVESIELLPSVGFQITRLPNYKFLYVSLWLRGGFRALAIPSPAVHNDPPPPTLCLRQQKTRGFLLPSRACWFCCFFPSSSITSIAAIFRLRRPSSRMSLASRHRNSAYCSPRSSGHTP